MNALLKAFRQVLETEEWRRFSWAGTILLLMLCLELLLVLRIRRKVKARGSPLRGDLAWTFTDLAWVTLAALPCLGVFLGLSLEAFRERMDLPRGLETLFEGFDALGFMLLGTLTVTAVSASTALVLGRLRHRLAWSELGFWFPGPKEALAVPVLAVAGFLLFETGYERVLAWGGTPFRPQILAGLVPSAHTALQRGALLVSAGLLIPVCEEILFRGFLFPLFSRTFGIFWGITLSSFLFAMGHVEPTGGGWAGARDNLLRIPLLFLLGLILCRLYHRSGSLAGPFLAHALNNVVALLTLLV